MAKIPSAHNVIATTDNFVANEAPLQEMDHTQTMGVGQIRLDVGVGERANHVVDGSRG
jgi:hypothetical protein